MCRLNKLTLGNKFTTKELYGLNELPAAVRPYIVFHYDDIFFNPHILDLDKHFFVKLAPSKKDIPFFMDEIAEAFGFPWYYSGNLDSFYECITSCEEYLESDCEKEYFLSIKNVENIIQSDEIKKLIETLCDAVFYWTNPALEGGEQTARKFYLIFQLDKNRTADKLFDLIVSCALQHNVS